MNDVLTMVARTTRSVAVINTRTGQTQRIFSVDGEITSGPNVAGNIGSVIVKNNGKLKAYNYDLQKLTVKSIYSV